MVEKEPFAGPLNCATGAECERTERPSDAGPDQGDLLVLLHGKVRP